MIKEQISSKLNAMNVLVTGGAGCAGSHLSAYFLSRGYRVAAVDNLYTGSMKNIEHNPTNPGFSFVRGNIPEKTLLNNPVGSIIDNATGSETVLRAAHKYHRRIVFASSSEVYGKNPKLPFAEEDNRLFGPTRVSRWGHKI